MTATSRRSRGRTIAVALLALLGASVASYLALVQIGVVAQPWDPVFGPASALRVLDSGISRALPVPDAALGALAYLAEVALALAGLVPRLARSHGVTVGYGVVALGLLGAAIVLVALQSFVLGSFCTLCLVSALISVVAASLAVPEAIERWHVVSDRTSATRPPSPERTTRRSVP